jgi:hypothetical protein
MVEPFILNLNPKLRKRSKVHGTVRPGTELAKMLRDRCYNCYTSDCWVPKDYEIDKGQMYLPHYYFNNAKRGRYVQIRQVLFQIAYQEPPPRGRKIHMHCGTPGCVNPGHAYVRGWKPSWPALEDMINRRGWLTEEQAKEWFAETA